MTAMVKHICVVLLLLVATGNCVAQKVNQFDRKGRKHGVWTDITTHPDHDSLIEHGVYVHGKREGKWETTTRSIYLTDRNGWYTSSTGIETYSNGKKNGWSVVYGIASIYYGGDTGTCARKRYVNDSLVEVISYTKGQERMYSTKLSRILVLDFHIYIDADSVFLVHYYNAGLKDSNKVQAITRWTRYDKVGSISSHPYYARPGNTKHTTITTYYLSGQVQSRVDSLLWKNHFEESRYFENGNLQERVVMAGHRWMMPQWEGDPYRYCYYENDTLRIGYLPDPKFAAKEWREAFDSTGTILAKSYREINDTYSGGSVDSVYSPAGTLYTYAVSGYDSILPYTFKKYYASGKRAHVEVGSYADSVTIDTMFYESGIIQEIRVLKNRGSGCLSIEYDEYGRMTSCKNYWSSIFIDKYFDSPGQLSRISWRKDSLCFDTTFYASGKPEKICTGLCYINSTCVSYYENGTIKSKTWWMTGKPIRREDYDESGKLIKSQ